MIRLFVSEPLAAGARLELPPDQARYLLVVMRLAAGDPLLVFNGRDGEWRASVAEASRKRCVLAVDELSRPQTATPDLELVVALVKRPRLETIVEKAAELGCRRVRLVVTRRTNADRANVERLQAIATEASEQTGRLDAPEITGPEKLDRLLDRWPSERRLVFCDEAGQARPMLHAIKPGGPWAVLIGPEGGFDPAERALLREQAFVTPVSLGPRILRADTAAIAALALWQAAAGDWRPVGTP